MKLYTEEQVTKLTSAAFVAGQNHNTFIFGVEFEKITPIELPSDEEIESKSSNEYQEQKQSYENSAEMFPFDFGNYLEVGFIQGAKWMRDKIQGGNK